MTEAWPYLLEELGKMLGEFTIWIADQVGDLTVAAIAWGIGIDDGILKGVKDNWWQIVAFIGSQLRKIPGFDLLMGTGASGTGGGSGPFAAPMGLAAAGAGVVSGVTVPSVQMVPRRRVEDVPHRGVIVAPPVVINVDARGSRDPVEVERAGYRGARRALEEAARERVGRRSSPAAQNGARSSREDTLMGAFGSATFDEIITEALPRATVATDPVHSSVSRRGRARHGLGGA